MILQFLPLWLVLIITVYFSTYSTAERALNFVRPSDNVSCTFQQLTPCLTLSEYAGEPDQYFFDNTTFIFLPGVHRLDIALNLENLSNVEFIASDDLHVVDPIKVIFRLSVHISWRNCHNIQIHGLVFDISIWSHGRRALLFHRTSSILSSLTLTGSDSGSAVFINDSSLVKIIDVHVSGTYAYNSVGSAIYAISSTVHLYGNISFVNNTGIGCCDAEIGCGGAIQLYDSTAIFSGNITFRNNSAIPYSTGGAMCIYKSNVTISGYMMLTENKAHDGGAVIAYYSNVSYNTSGKIIFVNNTASSLGGAITIFYSDLNMAGNIAFVNNSAISGGALNVYSSTSNISETVSFEKNTARYGGALQLINGSSCISGNVIFLNNIALEDGGAINMNSISRDQSLNLTGTPKFVRNSAQRGGAISFSGSSKLILTNPIQAQIFENHANSVGGVVYFHQSVIQCIKPQNPSSLKVNIYNDIEDCFIELSSESDIQLDFCNNTAGEAGRILYGGNLDCCKLQIGGLPRFSCVSLPRASYTSHSYALTYIANISSIVNNDCSISDISFDPFKVCICVDGDIDQLECRETEEETVRGKEITLQAVVVNRQHIIVPNSYVRAFADNGAQLDAHQHIQKTGKECTPIHYRLLGKTDTSTLKLLPENNTCRGNELKVKVKFSPCPIGFALSGSICDCDPRLLDYTKKCDINTNSIEKSETSFWMGINKSNDTNQELILHAGCPLDYCVDPPMKFTIDNPDDQCNYNRSGTLCGNCNDGFSIALGTLHCIRDQCDDYHLALILLFAVAGILLVATIMLLNLTVAVGTINGLIFYANVVQANRSIFFPHDDISFLSVFIAWLNLDFGFEDCFYDGMDIYVYTWLQFLFPLYIWCLIVLIILVSRYSRMVSKYLSKVNPVATLATLFLLSYFKILSNIVFALSATDLEYPNSTENEKVWLYNGNVPFFGYSDGANHTALGVFAILVLLLLFLPYTLLLLFGHWLQAYSHWRILSWVNKIKPFIDAYHAPYKKDTRYWTGLILLLRCVLFVHDAFSELHIVTSVSKLLIVTFITAGVATLAWIHNGVYEKFFNNIIEASFILNLCIFSAATHHVKQTKDECLAKLAYTSVGIAFAIFICIVVYHVYTIIHNTSLWKKIVNISRKKYNFLKSQNNSIIIKADHASSAVPPTSSVIELREPLIQ